MSATADRSARNRVWLAGGLLTAVTLLLLAPAAVCAHGPDTASDALDPHLDLLAPELAGVRVQIHRTAGHQLVIENRTGRTLELIDERGVAFARIGPQGVEGNLASPTWYRSFAPEGGRVPPELRERLAKGESVEPQWVRARREPTWGWFDARIDPDPHGGSPTGKGAGAKHWEIPVRIDGAPSALRGHFAPPPKPTGLLRARLASTAPLAPGVRISIVGAPGGALFLECDSDEWIRVIGRDGEPFLRFARSGVEANLHSATFAEVAQLRGGEGLLLEPRADAEPRWQRVSMAPRYAWVDPRTVYADQVPEKVTKRGVAAELLRWSVPVRIGDADDAPIVRVEGVTEWIPLASRRAPSPDRAEGS